MKPSPSIVPGIAWLLMVFLAGPTGMVGGRAARRFAVGVSLRRQCGRHVRQQTRRPDRGQSAVRAGAGRPVPGAGRPR